MQSLQPTFEKAMDRFFDARSEHDEKRFKCNDKFEKNEIRKTKIEIINESDTKLFDVFESYFNVGNENKTVHDDNDVMSGRESRDNFDNRVNKRTNYEDDDSGNESIDAEILRGYRRQSLKSTTTNLEELYSEILVDIIHNVGKTKCDPENLFTFMTEVFKFHPKKHEELLQKAKTEKAPELRLNVKVIEANDLNSKDPNGLADPFVTLYIASNPEVKCSTTIKMETLNPNYSEYFSLPIPNNPNEESLIVEVWDFDPVESIGRKLNKFMQIRQMKGFGKFMKEIASTVSSKEDQNELIGTAEVNLKTIPPIGSSLWLDLNKKGKKLPQGRVNIRVNFGSKKNIQVSAQEHRGLLKILLFHELQSIEEPHSWTGKFSKIAEAIISQHEAHGGLTYIDVAFTKWTVYTEVHQLFPLSFDCFIEILDILKRPIQMKNVFFEEYFPSFWESTKNFLIHCFGTFKKLRKNQGRAIVCVKHLEKQLIVMLKISEIDPPEGFDMFPRLSYTWMTKNEKKIRNIQEGIKLSVIVGAEDYFDKMVAQDIQTRVDSESRLRQMIKVIQMIRLDLQLAIGNLDKIFEEVMSIRYTEMIYKVYDKKIKESVKPLVDELCAMEMNQISKLNSKHQIEMISMLTMLFELFLLLKGFVEMGPRLCHDITDLQLNNYYEWFSNGVASWLDISFSRNVKKIEKSVESDLLDFGTENSSSVAATLAIFNQFKKFWQHLGWPNPESAFVFITNIVSDICKFCNFYAEKMVDQVDKLGNNDIVNRKFKVTEKWSIAINNIDHIYKNINLFVTELGTDEVLQTLSECQSEEYARKCKEILQNIIEDSLRTKNTQITKVAKKLSRQISSNIRYFLVQTSKNPKKSTQLMAYLNESLFILKPKLDKKNFSKVLEAIWDEIYRLLFDLVQDGLGKRQSASFYSNLRGVLHEIVENLKCLKNEETFVKIDKLLDFHSLKTIDLIHKYYMERHAMQQAMTEAPYGILTVQCYFNQKTLEIEVMNAKHLVAMDKNGYCDPFVVIELQPKNKFSKKFAQTLTTKVHEKTLFPMFDEKFSINLTEEQKNTSDALIIFSVKDKDCFGMSNQFVADAFMLFKDIPNDFGSSQQSHIKLSRHDNEESMESIEALKHRKDKLAREFLMTLNLKISDSQWQGQQRNWRYLSTAFSEMLENFYETLSSIFKA